MTNSVASYLCPKCNRTFTGRVTGNKSALRYPLIIRCGHTVCEICIESAARLEKRITCSICEECTELPEGKESINTLISDLHILGKLNDTDKKFNNKSKMKCIVNKLSLESYDVNNVVCDECSKRSAIWRCDKCVANYCNICFDNIHKASRVMKKHEAKPILVESYRRKVQEGCTEHEQRPIEFFCQDDNELACSFCVVLNDSKHKGHSLILLSEKNKSCIEDLKLGIEEGKKMLNKLHNAEKHLTKLLTENDTASMKIFNKVYDHFHWLHSLLQLRETELISQLQEIFHHNSEKLECMHQTVSHHHKELSSILQDAEQATENSLISMNIVDVVKKLHSVKELPCYLVPISSDQENEIKIYFDESFLDVIKSVGKIEANILPKFSLRNESELPPEYEYNLEEIQTDTESITSRTESFSEDISDEMQILPISVQKSYCKTLKQENVFVTHIQNPSHFWIQKINDTRKLKTLTDSINKFCFSPESIKCVPSVLKIGELYLVQYEADKSWYRARVKRIFDLCVEDITISDEIDPFKEKIKQLKSVLPAGKKILAYVYYIDFGNVDIVPISNIKTMQSRFLHLPGLAIECALWDILPNNNEKEWSISAIKTFASLVGDKELMMVVVENRNDILYVDLCQPGSQGSGIKNDVPVSIRDALVFMEVGCFVSENILEKQKLRAYINKVKHRQFYPPEPLALGKRLNVLLSHVTNPQHFYVQQMGGNARYLSNLIFDMQKRYNMPNSDANLIVAPQIGMICVAQYSLDKQWYRAQVIGLPGNAKVKIFYVDFGNVEIVPYKKLRKIADEHTKLPCQAIKCSLVDIAPLNEDWNSQANEWFTEAAGKKNLSLKVHKVIPGEGTAEVILYHIKDDMEICLNGLIVKEGIAKSTGEESCIIEIPRCKTLSSRKVSEEKPDYFIKVKHINNKSNIISQSSFPSKISKPIKNEEKKGYIAVHISHIVTPDCIYVHRANQTEQLEAMMEKLQKAYNQSELSEINIEVNKSYAVLNNKDQKWYRAYITKSIDDNTYEAQFLDYGFVGSVTKNRIQLLLQQFHEIDVFAVVCNLIGIIPAGGTKWSHIACEILKSSLIHEDIVYLQRKGSIMNESYPVDLYIKKIHSGALEVTNVEYKSITEMLIDKGVALPTEKNKKITSPKTEHKKLSYVENSEVLSETSERSPSPLIEKLLSQEELKVQDNIKIWKSPAIPEKKVFYGTPTHVGEDGCIYIHPDDEGIKNNLRLIKNALKLKYDKVENNMPKSYPSVGQTCAAKFILDNCWYRAVVTKVQPPNIQVVFVDYGNSEILTLENIHTDFILPDIPKQCIECILHGIEPKTENGEWLTSTLDFIHNNIVEQKCKVCIMDQPVCNQRIPIKLYCEAVDLIMLLVDVGHARLVNQLKICNEQQLSNDFEQINKKEEIEIKPFSPFGIAIMPEVGILFPVTVTQILHSNIVCIQRLKIDNPQTESQELINEEYDQFLLMMAELSENADQFSQLETVEIGMACCGMYTYDDSWYRCVVTDKTDDSASVTYIDYGNSEIIPIDRLRKLPTEYFILPQQTIVCKLYGVNPVGGEWTDEIVSKMVESVFPKEGKLIAQVNKLEETPEISLLIDTFEGSMKLAYQNLIDDGLIEIDRS